MPVFTFTGTTITIGVPTVGWAGGTSPGGEFKFKKSDIGGGAGIAINPFSISIECDCTDFQKGDHITIESTTFILRDNTKVTWHLCGGKCKGDREVEGWAVGIALSGLVTFTFE